MEEYPALLAPFKLGPLALRNRIVMPAMYTGYGTREGFVTQRNIDYYRARAAGGVAMLIVEFSSVDRGVGRASLSQLSIDHDRYLAGLSELAGAIKQEGAAAFIQLHHAGREAHPDLSSPPVGPSAIRSLNRRIPVPRALSASEIGEIIDRFVDAAVRAKRAGFEGVELHAAHGYLITQFLSLLCNDRDDEYGGSLENRARLLLEIVGGIKQSVGCDFPISVRLSATEFAEGGITIEDTLGVGRMLKHVGADVISVSAGSTASSKPVAVAPACIPNGFLLTYAEQVRSAVGPTVIGVGRINTPTLADKALRDGTCDMVALGRAMIADSEFPNKVATGRAREIRPCVACMHCYSMSETDDSLVCANNPVVGREREYELRPADKQKRVFVVGGGLAGMEAARTAASRGHDVTLFEREERLGGQLFAAAAPPHKAELELLRSYYEAQMSLNRVRLRVSKEIGSAALAETSPDVVVVATGGRPVDVEIPGADRQNVVLAQDVLLGKSQTGSRVVIIGAEQVGCEAAEFLAARGKQVTVVRRSSQRAASKMHPIARRQLLDRLKELEVAIVTNMRYEEIDDRGLAVIDSSGVRRFFEADTVVVAAGYRPADDLVDAIGDKVELVRVVGDAHQPRGILEAIKEGMLTGLSI